MPFWLLIQNLVLPDKPIGLLPRRLFLPLNSTSHFSRKSVKSVKNLVLGGFTISLLPHEIAIKNENCLKKYRIKVIVTTTCKATCREVLYAEGWCGKLLPIPPGCISLGIVCPLSF